MRSLWLHGIVTVACAGGSAQLPNGNTTGAPTQPARHEDSLVSWDAATEDAGPSTGSDARACATSEPPGLDDCRAELPGATATATSCDAGFHPKHTVGVHCSADDLVCTLRSLAWDHAPQRRPARPEEVPACWAECEGGNGASCARIGHAFSRRSTLGARCADHFAHRACDLGLTFACAESPGCGEVSRAEAFARLSRACAPERATWQCFYATLSSEMMWGTGLPDDPRAGYRTLCKAPCPPQPERCYRQMACEVASLP